MQFTILSFLLLINLVSYSQGSMSIVGKWKLISISGAEMSMNFKTDSVSLSGQLKEETAINNDSLASTEIAENMINGTDSYIVFTKGGIFENIFVLGKDTMREKGTYTIDKQKSIIKSTTSQGKTAVKKEDMHFIIKGKELHIKTLSNGEVAEPALRLVYQRVE